MHSLLCAGCAYCVESFMFWQSVSMCLCRACCSNVAEPSNQMVSFWQACLGGTPCMSLGSPSTWQKKSYKEEYHSACRPWHRCSACAIYPYAILPSVHSSSLQQCEPLAHSSELIPASVGADRTGVTSHEAA